MLLASSGFNQDLVPLLIVLETPPLTRRANVVSLRGIFSRVFGGVHPRQIDTVSALTLVSVSRSQCILGGKVRQHEP